jgi:hypothetical protein
MFLKALCSAGRCRNELLLIMKNKFRKAKKYIFLYAGVVFAVSIVLFQFRDKGGRAEVRVHSGALPKKVFVGDSLRYSLVVSAPSGYLLDIPERLELSAGLEARKASRRETERFGEKKIETKYLIFPYALGEHYIPPVTVKYRKAPSGEWKTARSKRRHFKVARLTDFSPDDPGKARREGSLPGTQMGSIPAEPDGGDDIDLGIRFRIDEPPELKRVLTARDRLIKALIVFFWLAASLIVAAISLSFFRHAFKKEALPPGEEAIKALNRLGRIKASLKGGEKEFFSRLYKILLDYMLFRFGMPEVKMTAKEIASWASGHDEISLEMKDFLKSRLELCDAIRYSGRISGVGHPDDFPEKDIEFIKSASPKKEKEEM